jgi:sugar phosphate isomerase/epimerase
MTLAVDPLSYCTNVHPGQSVAEVLAGLDSYTLPIQAGFGQPLAAGLWLARSVVDELPDANSRQRFAGELSRRGLTCYTLNTFPYGNFHSERVKEQVYLPDWTTPERQRYTLDCAAVLAELLPPGGAGSLSTVPLGFKALSEHPQFHERCIARLIKTAVALQQLSESTGKRIRLAIEPEPLCVLETTPETIVFFQTLFDLADQQGLLASVQESIGLCYDVCHQAVEFENAAEAISVIHRAGIRINKVHLSCAIEARGVWTQPAVRSALARYIEPRYLHQTFAQTPTSNILRWTDLDESLLHHPPAEWADAKLWRVHFHVPIHAPSLGPLTTTRPALEAAIPAIAELPYAPHLEVETYTWEVLPDGGKPHMVDGLTDELRSAAALVQQHR